MKRKRYIRPCLLLMALSVAVTLIPAEPVFSGGPALRSSGRSRHSGVHRSGSAPKHFNRSGFLFSDGFSESPSITVQQTVVTPPTQEPKKAKSKGIYVPPRWVDADHGVQILLPGHWIDPETKP